MTTVILVGVGPAHAGIANVLMKHDILVLTNGEQVSAEVQRLELYPVEDIQVPRLFEVIDRGHVPFYVQGHSAKYKQLRQQQSMKAKRRR